MDTKIFMISSVCFLALIFQSQTVLASPSEKLYLKDLIYSVQPEPARACSVKPVEMSIKLKDCGRVVFNATQCIGTCKSSQTFLPHLGLLRTVSSICVAKKFEVVKKDVVCSDKSPRTIDFQVITECSCSVPSSYLKKM